MCSFQDSQGETGLGRGQRLAGNTSCFWCERQQGEQKARTASWRGQGAGQSERQRGPGTPAVRQSARDADTGGLRDVNSSGRIWASVKKYKRDMDEENEKKLGVCTHVSISICYVCRIIARVKAYVQICQCKLQPFFFEGKQSKTCSVAKAMRPKKWQFYDSLQEQSRLCTYILFAIHGMNMCIHFLTHLYTTPPDLSL